MRCIWLVLFFASALQAAPSSKPITCKNGSDTRVLKNQKSENGNCEVTYEKNGKLQTVATSQGDNEYCDSSLSKIRATLEGAGFQCR